MRIFGFSKKLSILLSFYITPPPPMSLILFSALLNFPLIISGQSNKFIIVNCAFHFLNFKKYENLDEVLRIRAPLARSFIGIAKELFILDGELSPTTTPCRGFTYIFYSYLPIFINGGNFQRRIKNSK